QAVTASPTAPASITRSFSIDLGAAVIAGQTLRPAGCPEEQAYVLAVLRNHAVRLFRVSSEATQRPRVRPPWQPLPPVRGPGPGYRAAIRAELELGDPAGSGVSQADAAAWAYAVVDVVLPDLYRRVATLPEQEGSDFRRLIVDAACALIRRAARARNGE